MHRVLAALVIPLLSACAEEALDPVAADSGIGASERAGAGQSGSVACGESATAYENLSEGKVCASVTLTNNCGNDSTVSSGDKESEVDEGSTKTVSFTVASDGTVEIECGVFRDEACCEYTVAVGSGACAVVDGSATSAEAVSKL